MMFTQLLTGEHQFSFSAERNIENDLFVINCVSENVIRLPGRLGKFRGDIQPIT